MKKLLVIFFALAGCCSESTPDDCTVQEQKKMQEESIPTLLTEKDGVRVYWMKPCHSCNAIFFTTPCGDINWDEHVSHGKTSEEVRHFIPGANCK